MTYVALLRAVNLAGHKPVSMADLRRLLDTVGFSAVRTVLQSGNAVFVGTASPRAKLERRLESECAAALGLTTDWFVRTADEWRSIVEANPFPDEARRDPAHVVALALKGAPARDAVDAAQSAIAGPERVRAVGDCAYVVYPDGIGRSKVTSAFLEKRLGFRGTARNWNTVTKLAALSAES